MTRLSSRVSDGRISKRRATVTRMGWLAIWTAWLLVWVATPASAQAPAAAATKVRSVLILPFATVDLKLDGFAPVGHRVHLARETAFERNMNIAFSALLIATVVGLWIYFR